MVGNNDNPEINQPIESTYRTEQGFPCRLFLIGIIMKMKIYSYERLLFSLSIITFYLLHYYLHVD